MAIDLHQIIKYFGNDCTNLEKVEIESWKNASDENRKVFERLKQIWETSGKTTEFVQPDFEKAWKKIQLNTGIKDILPKQRSLRISVNQVLKIAATFLLIVGLYFVISKNYFEKPVFKIVQTSNSGKQEIHLSDGTTVFLNRNSKIYYPDKFINKTREIRLLGEAFFKVAKDRKHPFLIHTGDAVVKVLGTSFNIKCNDTSSVDVSVISGKVSLSGEKNVSESIQLVKGDVGIFNIKTQHLNKTKYSDENFLAWETGILKFNNQPLSEVVKVLSEYYSRKIEAEPSMQNRLITVSFDNQPFDEALKILEITLDIKIDINPTRVLLQSSSIKKP
jgi:transmembrane sensor